MSELSDDNLNKLKKIMEDRDYLRATSSAFFDLSLDLMAIAGTDGYFVLVNDRWTEVTGWSKGELTSKPFIDFVHPDDVKATRETYSKAEGEDVVDFRNRYKKRNGDYVTLCWRSRMDNRRGVIFATARVEATNDE